MFVLTKYKIFFAIGLLLLVALAGFNAKKVNKKQLEAFNHFYAASIKGIVSDSVYTSSQGTVFRVKEDNFTFYPTPRD